MPAKILRKIDLTVERTAFHERIVGTHVRDAALIEDEDLIRVHHRSHPLGDEQNGAAELAERGAQTRVRGVIERRCAVIEDEDLRVPHEGAGNGKSLALAARKISPLLRDFAVQAALGLDDVPRLCDLHGAEQFFIRRVLLPPAEVGGNGAAKEHGLLRNIADARAQFFHGDGGNVRAVQIDMPFRRLIEAGQKAHERGFSRTRTAQDAHRFAALRGERDIGKRGRAATRVSERHLLKCEMGSDFLGFFRIRPLRRERRFGRGVEDRADALCARDRLRHGDDEIGELDEFDENDGEVPIEREYVALPDRARVDADRAHIDEGDRREIDEQKRDGTRQRGNAPHPYLRLRQRAVLAAENALLLPLHAEGADDARTRKVFPRGEIYAVQLLLHILIAGDTGEHDDVHGGRKERNEAQHDESRPPIDEEGHARRPEYDDGRTQKEAQRHIHAVLHLLDVARHAGEHRRGTHAVDLREGKRL